MRVGIVSKWYASGQGVVSRQLRSAIDQLGHETVVLARPGRGPRAARHASGVDELDPVWSGPGVSEASAHEISEAEYRAWADDHGLELILCDENYQFRELASLRRTGIRVVGRFVWESFSPADADGAGRAYDAIYSLTRCEQRRYREIGIESPYVRWGIHPELLEVERPSRDDDFVRYIFPCSFFGPRRPVGEVLTAFRAVAGEQLRLLITAQLPRRSEQLRKAAARDPRIELELSEQPTAEYLAQFAACDVCLAPSRWEGLGVPLFEAIALGLPIITNDAPPMNEMVTDGINGLLTRSAPAGTTKSGIRVQDPDIASLSEAIARLADRDLWDRLAAGARRVRAERAWAHTLDDLAGLLEPFGDASDAPSLADDVEPNPGPSGTCR